jgi:hypothetical protein
VSGRRSGAILSPSLDLNATRVSTDMQAEHGQSLDLQRDPLAGWAQMTQRRIDQTITGPL